MTDPTAAEDRAARLTEIRARLDAATPGPWFASGPSPYGDDCTVTVGEDADELAICPDCGTRGGMDAANALFVSHAPEDVAFLLSELEAAQAREADARAALERRLIEIKAARDNEHTPINALLCFAPVHGVDEDIEDARLWWQAARSRGLVFGLGEEGTDGE